MYRYLTPRLLGCALLAGLAAGSASAANDRADLVVSSQGVTRTVAVRTHDLDLRNAQARDKLAWRIDVAARRACDIHIGSDIDRLPSAQTCYKQALTDAHSQMQARGVALPVRVAMR